MNMSLCLPQKNTIPARWLCDASSRATRRTVQHLTMTQSHSNDARPVPASDRRPTLPCRTTDTAPSPPPATAARPPLLRPPYIPFDPARFPRRRQQRQTVVVLFKTHSHSLSLAASAPPSPYETAKNQNLRVGLDISVQPLGRPQLRPFV